MYAKQVTDIKAELKLIYKNIDPQLELCGVMVVSTITTQQEVS